VGGHQRRVSSRLVHRSSGCGDSSGCIFNALSTECQALPECLNKWLFPGEGQTRDLRTLQVSLGSNDEFFASDKDGKLSSRDPSCQVGEKKPVPRLAEIARGMMRKKSHTISSPTFPADAMTRLDSKPESPKLVRRSTFQLGQDNPRTERKQSSITPLIEQPLLTRLEPKQKAHTTVSTEEEIVVKNLDDGTENKLAVAVPVGQQQSSPKPDSNSAEEQPVLKRPNVPKIEHSRRKSILIGAPPPVRPSLPNLQTVSTMRENLPSRGIQEIVPVTRPPLPKMQIPLMTNEILQPKRYQENPVPAKVSRYVDAGVQTEVQVDLCGVCAPFQAQLFPLGIESSYSYLPPQHEISIGHMQDFCRDEYQLGGMLSTYV
jgi:hypothetical protein